MQFSFSKISDLEDRLPKVKDEKINGLRNTFLGLMAGVTAFIWFMPKDLYDESRLLVWGALLLLLFVLFSVLYLVFWPLIDLSKLWSISTMTKMAREMWIADWKINVKTLTKSWFLDTLLILVILCLVVGILLHIIFFIHNYF